MSVKTRTKQAIIYPSAFLIMLGVGIVMIGILILSINFTHIIPVSFVLYSLFGLSLSLFWPQAMGWISHGYEGETLNKLLSLYNLS